MCKYHHCRRFNFNNNNNNNSMKTWLTRLLLFCTTEKLLNLSHFINSFLLIFGVFCILASKTGIFLICFYSLVKHVISLVKYMIFPSRKYCFSKGFFCFPFCSFCTSEETLNKSHDSSTRSSCSFSHVFYKPTRDFVYFSYLQ